MSSDFNDPLDSPEDALLASVLMGPSTLSDAQLVASLLEPPDLRRAEDILRNAGNLNLLAHAGPLELSAWGLRETESVRAMLTLEWAGRVLAQRRARRLASLEETVNEVRLRGESCPRECVGILAVDRHNRILIDRILFQGSHTHCPVDIPELLREVLRVGADAFVLIRWSPLPEVQVLPSDRELADHLRVLTSALHLTFMDMLIVAQQSYWSARNQDDWVTP